MIMDPAFTWKEKFHRDIGMGAVRLFQRTCMWRRFIESPGAQQQVFFAKDDEAYVGVSLVTVKPDEEHWLDFLYVLESYRGQGIGRQLLDAAHEWHGPQHPIHLETLTHNEVALRLYQRQGYVVVGEVEEDKSSLPPGARKWISEYHMIRPSQPDVSFSVRS